MKHNCCLVNSHIQFRDTWGHIKSLNINHLFSIWGWSGTNIYRPKMIFGSNRRRLTAWKEKTEAERRIEMELQECVSLPSACWDELHSFLYYLTTCCYIITEEKLQREKRRRRRRRRSILGFDWYQGGYRPFIHTPVWQDDKSRFTTELINTVQVVCMYANSTFTDPSVRKQYI